MFSYLKNKYTFLGIFVLILTQNQCIKAQTKNENSLYNWFDAQVNIENLDITNGKLAFNPFFRTLNNDNRFLTSEVFTIGEVIYENQFYGQQELNYDAFSDELYLKPKSKNNKIAILLNTQSIKEFVVENKKFVNLTYQSTIKSDFISGFYEEIYSSNNNTLYIKHIKLKHEKFVGKKIFYEFEPSKSYFVFYNNVYYDFNSKRNVQKVFPKLKSKIKSFYSDNIKLEKQDKTLFTKNMINYINAFGQDK